MAGTQQPGWNLRKAAVTTNDIQQFIPEILACLESLAPAKVILFGSGAQEEGGEVGDLDLLVVTQSRVFPQTYREKESIYLPVARALRRVRRRVPVDLIVHTQPMHARFVELNSQFAQEVLREGKVLYESPHA